jgi:CRP-like cAMP-binding protein
MTPVSRKLCCRNDLSDGDADFLDREISNRRYVKPREDIVSEHEGPSDIRVLMEGVACRYKLIGGGRRAIVAYLLPGDFCDLHVSLLGRRDHGVATLTGCTVAVLARNTIDSIIYARPALARALWRTNLVDEAVLREWLANLSQRPANRRLVHLICELRVRLETVGLADRTRLKLPVTQEELGDTLGISSVHVNRIFQQLKHDHLITVHGRELLIPDLERLEEFGEFAPDYLA